MERTSFENLRVYQLSEDLADLIWEIAIKWNNLDSVFRTIKDSLTLQGARLMKQNIGFVALLSEIC
jgi:hypothetical protein